MGVCYGDAPPVTSVPHPANVTGVENYLGNSQAVAMTSPAVYDLHRPRYAFYQDAYYGGDFWRSPSCPTLGNAQLVRYVKVEGRDDIVEAPNGIERSYLVPYPGESPTAFRARHSLASYLNFISSIVDAYADAATADVTRNLGMIKSYACNLNGRGRTWDQHMSEVARWDAVYGFTATLIDMPKANPAANKLQEDESKIGARATIIHPPAIAWVDVDCDGCIEEFAFVDQPFASDLNATQQTVFLYRYTKTDWEKREVTIGTSQGFTAQRDDMMQGTVVDKGVHAFPGEVPVRFSFFREVTNSRYPVGVSLIADAADIAREVYNTLSNIGDIHRKTAFPFLAIPTKATGSQLEPETRIEVGPEKALGYPSDTGVPQWVQPSAEQTKELRDHIVFLIGAAFRMAGLEVATEGTSDVQSGLAIQLKSRGFEGRCKRFAENLQQYELGCLGLIAKALRLSADFDVTYPKRFVLPDASEDLARAILVLQTIGADNLGPEGEIAAIRQALNAALSLDDKQLTTILEGIKAKRLATSQGPLGASLGAAGAKVPGNPFARSGSTPKAPASGNGQSGPPVVPGTGG